MTVAVEPDVVFAERLSGQRGKALQHVGAVLAIDVPPPSDRADGVLRALFDFHGHGDVALLALVIVDARRHLAIAKAVVAVQGA